MTEPDVAAAVQEGARVLESLGARVPSIEYPDLAHYADNGAFLADAAAYHEETLKERWRTRRSSEPACVMLDLRAVDYSRARYKQLESNAP